MPIEDTWESMKSLCDAGKVRYLGISEAAPRRMRRRTKMHPITGVADRSTRLWNREVEDRSVAGLARAGIGFVAYSPLGRGFITG